MLFKNIEICNFGRYKGINRIDMKVTPERNVILIKGNNDRGKTTLFKAIKFALYGENNPQEGIHTSINLDAAAEGNGEMYVELKFEDKGKEYRLRRSIKFKQTEKGKPIIIWGKSKTNIFDDDSPHLGESEEKFRQDWIDSILPKDASQFFFFDGEEIQKYINKEETHVKEAIEKVLGITPLLNARDDLKQVKKSLDGEFSKILRKQTTNENDKKKLDKHDEDIENKRLSIQAEQKALEGAESYKADVEKKQKKFAGIADLVADREKEEENLRRIEKSIQNDESNLRKSRGYLGLVLLEPLLDIIKRTKENPPPSEQWESQIVKRMINENMSNCVCGRPINDEIQNLLKSKILGVEPTSESKVKRNAELLLLDHNPDNKWLILQQHLTSLSEDKHNADESKSTIESYNKEIGGNVDTGSTKELQDQHEQLTKDIQNSVHNIKNFEDDLAYLISEKDKLADGIKSNGVNIEFENIELRKNKCELITECFDNAIRQFYEKRKPELENFITQIFIRLTNNPELYEGVVLDNEFRIMILRTNGTKIPTHMYAPSAGASQIVATSMIGGFNKFSTKNAPIIIDTPLGRLDPVHKESVINYYSEMGKQIIIMYQPNEINDNDIENIRDHLASEWEIDSTPDNPSASNINRTKVYV